MTTPAVKRPVRVLVVAPAPVGDGRIGGIANFIRGFISHMPPDFEAEIVGVAVGDEHPGSGWRQITLGGRRVRFLPVSRVGEARRSGRVPAKARIVAGMLRHRRLIATAGRVAQVHAPGMDLGLVGRSVPIVRVVHNAPDDLAANEGESLWRTLGSAVHGVERLSFARADKLFFVNHATRDQYAAAMPAAADRMHYLLNGIDTDVFKPLYGEARAARRSGLAAELSLPVDAPWLLFAGRLDHQKDPLLLIRSFAAYVAGAGRATRLLVAGEGRLRGDAEQLAAELGIADRVTFLGLWPHERLGDLMATADAFVLTSAFEAAPFVVLEALASGLPVAATAVGEVPKQVRHGATGYIARDRSEASMAEAIGWALGQDHDAIARATFASVEHYELRETLAPFYEAHRQLARDSSV